MTLHKLGPFGITRAKVFLSFSSTSEAGLYRVDFRNKLSVSKILYTLYFYNISSHNTIHGGSYKQKYTFIPTY